MWRFQYGGRCEQEVNASRLTVGYSGTILQEMHLRRFLEKKTKKTEYYKNIGVCAGGLELCLYLLFVSELSSISWVAEQKNGSCSELGDRTWKGGGRALNLDKLANH